MKVLVVDDEKPARERLKQLLEDEADFDFVGEAGNGGDALKLSTYECPVSMASKLLTT